MKKVKFAVLLVLIMAMTMFTACATQGTDSATSSEDAGTAEVGGAMFSLDQDEAQEFALRQVDGEVTNVSEGEVQLGDLTLATFVFTIDTGDGDTKEVAVTKASGDVFVDGEHMDPIE